MDVYLHTTVCDDEHDDITYNGPMIITMRKTENHLRNVTKWAHDDAIEDSTSKMIILIAGAKAQTISLVWLHLGKVHGHWSFLKIHGSSEKKEMYL